MEYNRETNQEDISSRMKGEIDAELQIPLKEVSQRLARELSDTAYQSCADSEFPTRKQAIWYFEENFMKRELRRVKGNITQYVRDAFGADDEKELNNLRRNVYRKIERYGLGELIDNARPWRQTPLEERVADIHTISPERVASSMIAALSEYKGTLHPDIYENLASKINEKSYLISRKISDYLPTPARKLDRLITQTEGIRSYKEAKSVFEREVVYGALEAADFDKKKAAKYLGDSLRTLNRKIEELGIGTKKKEDPKTAAKPDIKTDEKVQLSETERFNELVKEYNARREEERKRKKQEPIN